LSGAPPLAMPDAKLVRVEAEQFGRILGQTGWELQHEMYGRIRGDQRLHGGEAGPVIRLSRDDGADWFWVDRQRGLGGFVGIAQSADQQRVGGVGENTAEIEIMRIFCRTVELKPENAPTLLRA